MIKISKDFEFCAAHHLPKHDGLCKNLHGHTWKVRVTYIGNIDGDTGMLEDFKTIKAVVEPIIFKLDHSLLNDILPNPTAEHIASYITNEVARVYRSFFTNPTVFLEGVKVWESKDSFVTVKIRAK